MVLLPVPHDVPMIPGEEKRQGLIVLKKSEIQVIRLSKGGPHCFLIWIGSSDSIIFFAGHTQGYCSCLSRIRSVFDERACSAKTDGLCTACHPRDDCRRGRVIAAGNSGQGLNLALPLFGSEIIAELGCCVLQKCIVSIEVFESKYALRFWDFYETAAVK